MTALAIIHKQDIISRLSAGETITSIGKSLNITKQAISQYLHNDPEYIAARIEFHGSRLDQVEVDIKGASDALDLARTRELATMYRWRAERECRDLYGKDTAPTPPAELLNTVSAALLLRVANLLPKQSNVIHEHDVTPPPTRNSIEIGT